MKHGMKARNHYYTARCLCADCSMGPLFGCVRVGSGRTESPQLQVSDAVTSVEQVSSSVLTSPSSGDRQPPGQDFDQFALGGRKIKGLSQVWSSVLTSPSSGDRQPPGQDSDRFALGGRNIQDLLQVVLQALREDILKCGYVGTPLLNEQLIMWNAEEENSLVRAVAQVKFADKVLPMSR